MTQNNKQASEAKTIFIACAALGREVKAIINKHGWNADFQAIDAKLHLRPEKIGPAVEERLAKIDGQWRIVNVLWKMNPDAPPRK